ncbi:B12-binding domain-containing radical SAM protein, partial [Pelagibacteraceae bacterium]|nr:B12-binding domain-containing radical SAM protein [Pelagibacteraceae bacterium]
MDVVFINPSVGSNYQSLKNKYTSIEPPTWSLLLAESMRKFGFKVSIIDANAENLDHNSVYKRLMGLNPKLVCFVVYGQNVNAGTSNMEEATKLSDYIKSQNKKLIVSYIGSYVQALPKKALEQEKSIDFVFTNEGVYALKNVLTLSDFTEKDLKKVKGIAYRDGENININSSENIVPNERMDTDLPGYAWDLLPYKNKPLDLYRSPMWHAEYDENQRSPYAALQTSLGCQFKCSFCMINLINRNDDEEIGVSSNYSKMRFWSPSFIIKEFEKLIKMGVKTIRITDEMFLLNPKYYKPLCEKLASLNTDDSLRMWAYSRIDTVKNPEILSLVRKAGIKWLCLGIESGDKNVRLEVSKGKFEDVDVRKVVKQVHDADIDIMANYMFGLPGDTEETIRKTFELSLDLCTSGWNIYATMALPGSLLYKEAVKNNIRLPENYSGYSFHSYDTVCLPTEK